MVSQCFTFKCWEITCEITCEIIGYCFSYSIPSMMIPFSLCLWFWDGRSRGLATSPQRVGKHPAFGGRHFDFGCQHVIGYYLDVGPQLICA